MKASALLAVVLLSGASVGFASEVFTTHYPASTRSRELQIPADFHLWLPPGDERLRAVIVHQHGCGEGAEMSGETAALDLHWQALAAKHNAALLSPHYMAGTNNCRLWCDPRQGSEAAFLRALSDLGQASGHPELASIPWCLWGHSGGGFWASLMLEQYPERIVAIFCRSGTATTAWEKGEIPKPTFRDTAFRVPVILNPGIKERDDKNFNGAWTGSLKFFEQFRGKGAPVAFAPDPVSSHDCRNSRLLAIPFFDACLRLRLPALGERLKTVDQANGFVGDWQTGTVRPALGSGNDTSWLPDSATSQAFSEYVRYGVTTDRTPPKKAPVLESVDRDPASGGVVLKWHAVADFESGIRQFIIYRNGMGIARYPEEVNSQTGFPQFQPITYHDTPPKNAPEMRFIDKTAPPAAQLSYAVSMINGVGLESPRSAAVKVR
jgi:pimeloyl-ACP methyl ester carboxylesterase